MSRAQPGNKVSQPFDRVEELFTMALSIMKQADVEFRLGYIDAQTGGFGSNMDFRMHWVMVVFGTRIEVSPAMTLACLRIARVLFTQVA
jgi:hypothetical protein